MYNTLSLLDHTCTFNTEILAALEVFKNRLFYHILKDFLITPVNLRYIHVAWFSEQLEMGLQCIT